MMPNQSYYQKSISPDEYMDLAIKNVLTYNAQVAQKEGALDLKKIVDMQVYLINQCETVCAGCGFINRAKKKLSVTDLTPDEAELYEAAKKFFSKQENIFGATVERLASRLLAQSIEGEYDAKVAFMDELLNQQIKDGLLRLEDKPLKLANYKFQLMLDAVSSSKSKSVDFDM